jgi:hypothetical protein
MEAFLEGEDEDVCATPWKGRIKKLAENDRTPIRNNTLILWLIGSQRTCPKRKKSQDEPIGS